MVDNLPQDVSYDQIKKVISVSVVYFNLGAGNDYVYHGTTSFRGLHFDDELKLDEDQKLAYGVQKPAGLYPECYLLKINNFNDIAKDGLDEWIYFPKNESIRPEFSAKGLAEANEQLDILNLDDQQRREYENWEMELHQRASMVKNHYGRGLREGMEKATAELVRNMLKNGMSAEQVSQATGLPVDKIRSLLIFVCNYTISSVRFFIN